MRNLNDGKIFRMNSYPLTNASSSMPLERHHVLMVDNAFIKNVFILNLVELIAFCLNYK